MSELEKTGIIVYDTSHGNTKTIADAIAETLKISGFKIEIFKVNNVKGLDSKDYDFLVAGSPTKFGTMSFATKSFLRKIKTEKWINKPFVAFDTENPENIERSIAENKDWSAAEKIAGKLKEKNMKQVLPVLKAVVFGKEGPLKEGEIERTKDYANQFAAKLTTGGV